MLGSMKSVLAVLFALVSSPVIAMDACSAQLPGTLKVQVANAFPAFRMPAVTDNLQEDVEWALKEKGKGCLGVAKADFDGNGENDFLLGLTAKKGTGATVLVALSRNGKWKLDKLAAWPNGRSRLYVSAEKPGTYVSLLDGARELGGVDRLKCANSVAMFGATESSGVVYCYKNGTWRHAWVSD